ncbi:hypothetical protein BE20_36970 [Sorangium cellulosum]|nr:hypothetical protein BE20_36970 [Sorangium cellulosum]
MAWREAAFAHKNVPFFRKRASPLPASPSTSTFAEVPATTKADYRKNFPAGILVDGRSLSDPYVQRYQSSGTSGDRLISVVHSFKLAERMASCLSVNRSLAFLRDAPKIRMCRYAAPNCSDVECSNPNTSMEDRILQDGTLVLPVYHDLLTTPEPMLRAAFEELHSYEPNVWYMDPMHLSVLIKKARSAGWEFDLNRKVAVLLTYTFATRALLRQIDAFCGGSFPVASVMAMSEFGFVGLGCEHGRLHLDSKDFYLEFSELETRDQPSPLWELFITSVGDRLCPHVRYRTNDVYELLGECECGSPFPAVAFQGRTKDLVRLPSGRVVTPGALDAAVGAPEWIDIFQLTYQRPSSFIFRYSGDAERYDAAEMEALRARLADLLRSTSIRFEAVQYFPFERGGKFQLIRTS